MSTGLLAFSILVTMAAAAFLFAVWHERQISRERSRREQASSSLALELHPTYQQKVAADRAYELQCRKLQAEQYKFDREFALKQYMALHYVSPETYLVNAQPTHITALPSLKQVAEKTTMQQLPNEQETSLPYAPPFASVKPLIQPGRLVLGYSAEGPVWGDVGDLLSMAVGGMPGTGKSSALLYFIAILSLAKAHTYVIDPHGSLNELSRFLAYCDDPSELGAFLSGLYAEFVRRMQLWKRSKTVLDPVLLLVDELPVLARYEQKHASDYSLLDLAEDIVLEGRKLNMFCILAGQSFPATILPTLTRDNLSSRLVFNSKDMHARMAGLDKESRAILLPLLRKAQPGTAILDVARKAEPCIVSLPLTTIDDLRTVIESAENFGETAEISGDFENHFAPLQKTFQGHISEFRTPQKPLPKSSKYTPTEEEIAEILRLSAEGYSRVQIQKALGFSGDKYSAIKDVLDHHAQEA